LEAEQAQSGFDIALSLDDTHDFGNYYSQNFVPRSFQEWKTRMFPWDNYAEE